MCSYQDIVMDYSTNLRDIKTWGGRLWFRPSIKNGVIYAESGKISGGPNSKISSKRPLKESDYTFMLKMYHKFQEGDAFSEDEKKRLNRNYNKSYWFGIFADLGF